MKKIAYMTWTYHNYGSLLQAFATQRVLKDHGYEITLINYLTEKKDVIRYQKKTLPFVVKKVNSKLLTIIVNKKMGKVSEKYREELQNKEKSFQNFIKNELPLSKKYNRNELINNFNENYDAYVVGSDQIWSPKFLDGSFFLDYIKNGNNKISYAPSFGVTELPNEVVDIIKPWINQFNHISIREIAGKKILKDNFDIDAQVVMDPTFLLSKEDWSLYIKDIDENDYIFCYFLSNNDYYWEIVKKIEKELNKKVVVLPNNLNDYQSGYKLKINVDPFDFLSFIKGASFVLTDSFHGTVFSTIFEKDFYTLSRFPDSEKGSENSRIESILEILHLKDRYVKWDKKIQYPIHISYDRKIKTNEIIKDKVNKSIEYLLKSIEN